MDHLDRMSRRKNQSKDTGWYSEDSKKRFSKNAKKKMDTCFIGIISIIEESFGQLWGHNNPEPTETQLKNRKIWKECRQKILDHGNHQGRGLQNEIDEYDFKWNRYSI